MNNKRSWRGNRGNFNRDGNFRGRYGRGGRRGRGNWFGPNRMDFNGHNPNNFENNYHQHQNYSRTTLTKRLSENEIGITQYINDHEGFNGIIKSRYSDFQVSEINMNGEVAKLTNLEPPVLPKDKDIEDDEELVLNKYNLEILPMETWDDINKLAVAKGQCTDKVQVDVTGMTKEQRTKIHDAVKKAFGRGIVGSTVTVDDKKYVSFEKFRKGVRVDSRVKWRWPGEYVYFIVHKENCDTMEAAARIAERLRLNLKPSMLGYAGTKDRRAKTSQWFSLRKVDPSRIAAACRDLREIHVGNFSFADTNLKLGMLKGNKFRIVLRNVVATDECINEACSLLKQKGFINYYGLQRFGTRIETPTYEIGLKLFQGKLLEAVNRILEPRPGPLQHALGVYAARGAAAAWAAWCAGGGGGAGGRGAARRGGAEPAELRLLRALAARPADLASALGKIPRNTRLLYIHSYQSLIWNKVASERLSKFGFEPVVGDLVPLASIHVFDEILDDEYSDSEDTDDMQLNSNDTDTKTDTDNSDTNKEDKKSKENITEECKEIPVKVLTQEDIDSGQYTIFDVVLPLPGSSIKYPENMREYYEKLLKADGLTLDMKNKNKWLRMSGAYRALAVRPADVRWRGAAYADPHADLLLSDYDELVGHTRTGVVQGGKFKALILSLTLPTSCYATMALRELLKVDTSSDNQALQNNYHKLKSANKNVSENQNDNSLATDQTESTENGNENQVQSDNKNQDQSENQNQVQSENQNQIQSENQNQVQSENQTPVESENENHQESGEKRKIDSTSEVDAKKVKQDT